MDPETLELRDERSQFAFIVEPFLILGNLLKGQDLAHGRVVHFAGPIPVGAVKFGAVQRGSGNGDWRN
jgi:hypothetical protein